MKKSTSLLILVFLFLNSLFLVAQPGDTIEIHRKENKKISFARFRPDSYRKITEGKTFLKVILEAKPDDDLRLIKEETDEFGIHHLRYQQYYKDIKVENAEYMVHGKNGIIETINGDFQVVNISTVKPDLNEQQSLSKAMDFVKANKYKWEDANMQKFIKQTANDPNATYYPKGELVISKDFLKGGKNLKLAWKFTISSLLPENEQLIYIDALTGEVIRVTPLIYDSNVTGTAQTNYSGEVSITCDSYASGYRLKENRNGVEIITLNLQGTSNYTNWIEFSNTNTNWSSGNWETFQENRQALDAHWGSEKVLDYWVSHQRNSIDGSGLRILGYVHRSPDGYGWPNAQWVGGQYNHFMQYGDGDGLITNPVTALDICAHEMGHGITEFTAGLTPGTQESGALNEGFSDIWAACIENWAAPEKNTWLVGEEIFIDNVFSCIRNLRYPESTSTAEGPHPSVYNGQNWDINGEPHNNSTVLSHWFYLLSVGGADTNDVNSRISNIDGIGIEKAADIAYYAESHYLSSSSDYFDCKYATLYAAYDLYGQNSCEAKSVINAWAAVGIGDTISKFSINGPSSLYSEQSGQWEANVQCNPGNYSYVWRIDGVINSYSSTSWTTFLDEEYTYHTVSLEVISGNRSEIIVKDIFVSPEVFLNVYIAGDQELNSGQMGYWEAITHGADEENNSYNWYIDDVYYSNDPSISYEFYDGEFTEHKIDLTVTSGTQTSEAQTNYVYVTPERNMMSQKSDKVKLRIFPNPASNSATIEISDNAVNTKESEIYYISINDYYGRILFSGKMFDGIITINTSKFYNGIYTVVVTSLNKKVSSQFVIKK